MLIIVTYGGSVTENSGAAEAWRLHVAARDRFVFAAKQGSYAVVEKPMFQ